MTNFGASFKKARESKGISLDRISAETRISTRFLRAIENEEFHLLPGGIFNRGFVRAYAQKIGLDPDQTVADYERLSATHEPSEIPGTATTPPAQTERHFYRLVIGGLILVIVIFYIIFYIVTKESPNIAQTATLSSPPVAAAPPVVEPAPPTTPPVTTSAAPEPEPASPTEALRIDLEAKETTWIKVKADGSTVNSGEVLEPGMTRHFAAQNSVALIVGNAGGLVLKINDMPAKNLGKSGQVREVNITPKNLKDFIG